jgi:thymidylate kinase
MIIEFIGTPGSGKTTLIPVVTGYLAQQAFSARTVVEASRDYTKRTFLGKHLQRLAPQKLQRFLLWQTFLAYSLFHRLVFYRKHPHLIHQTLRAQYERPTGAEVKKRRVLPWFFHLAGYYEFLNHHIAPGEALILDEGFIHRVVQLFASDVETPCQEKIEAYIDLVPQPDLVVALHAPPEVCLQRVFKRGVWAQFHQKNPDEILRYITNAHQVVNIAVDHMKRKGWSMIEIDNGSDDCENPLANLRNQLPVPRPNPAWSQNGRQKV